MKNNFLNLFILANFCLFLLSCEKPEESVFSDHSISEMIGKIETIYAEGDHKVETTLKDGEPKYEFSASDEYLLTIKRLYESNTMHKKATKSLIGERVGIFKSGSCGNYDLLEIHMDCEDRRNSSSKSGWWADNYVDGNVTLKFCLVPKNEFSSSMFYKYAVLSLDYGWDDMIERHFDNEDNSNSNWAKLNSVTINQTGIDDLVDAGSGIVLGSNITLCFYVYKQDVFSGSTTFPSLGGINYGVLGYFGNYAKGYVHTDDEDSNNSNKMWYNWELTTEVQNIITGGSNTIIYMTKVK